MYVDAGGPELLRLMISECVRIAKMTFNLWGYEISIWNIIVAEAAISGIGYVVWKIVERD